jgi:hypothetical protein
MGRLKALKQDWKSTPKRLKHAPLKSLLATHEAWSPTKLLLLTDEELSIIRYALRMMSGEFHALDPRFNRQVTRLFNRRFLDPARRQNAIELARRVLSKDYVFTIGTIRAKPFKTPFTTYVRVTLPEHRLWKGGKRQ